MTPITLYQSEESAPSSLSSAMEDGFLHTWKEARRHFIAKLALVAVSVLSFLSALLYKVMINANSAVPVSQAGICLVAVILFAQRGKIGRPALRLCASLLVWVQMAFCMLYIVDQSSGQMALLVPLGVGMLSTACFVILYPADRFSLTVMVIVNIAISGSALFTGGSGLPALIIYSLFCLFILALRLYFDVRRLEEGKKEFRYRMMCAPPHIVAMGAGGSFQDSIEKFAAKSVFCVCLATDWRRYFGLKSVLSPSQLSMSVSEFYDLCERILRICLPKGNYFTDWIADELSLTIFATEDTTQKELVACAMDFATRLITARSEFTRMHGVPTELDLGISSGDAIIGMMGPESHKKATALGEVPGRARRIYGAGRLMRMILGPMDKIIMDSRTAALIDSDCGQKRIVLSQGQSIRDFADREIFVIVPESHDHKTRHSGVA